jgi:hypothetical protein
MFRVAALCAGLLALAQASPALDDEALGFERTPPRLSFLDGEVSFYRPGAEDWTPARVNIALAAGDELYTGARANLELQIGARAFARAGEDTQLGLTSLEPDYLQIRVTTGTVSLDLRSLKAGQTLELDTPNAAFRIERSGYYRVAIDGDTTTFTSRRGGHATLTTASGDTALIAASEQVIVRGTDAPQLESYAAPELDAWDRWNYARTDDQLDAVSARYLPSDVYGADDLDQHGDWRLLPSYGAVWVPRTVAVGWVPYSTGRWLYDPWYGWTWLDDAPWGWAPYHYGRWVRVSGFWGWCPGPRVRRAYYAPALVAFYGGGGFNLGVTIGQPWVGWVALGYGEPLVPWWGPSEFRRHPRWAGWGGRRFANHAEIHHGAVIRRRDLHDYQNARERDAVVSVKREHFGRRTRQGDMPFNRAKPKQLEPLGRELDVAPDATSLVPELGATRRPPRETWQRSVVATREPRIDRAPGFETKRATSGSQPRREPPDAAAARGDAAAVRPTQRRPAPHSASGTALRRRGTACPDAGLETPARAGRVSARASGRAERPGAAQRLTAPRRAERRDARAERSAQPASDVAAPRRGVAAAHWSRRRFRAGPAGGAARAHLGSGAAGRTREPRLSGPAGERAVDAPGEPAGWRAIARSAPAEPMEWRRRLQGARIVESALRPRRPTDRRQACGSRGLSSFRSLRCSPSVPPAPTPV